MKLAKNLYTIFAVLVVMAVITAAMTLSGFDAWWFSHMHASTAAQIFGLAGFAGFVGPVVIWAALLLTGYIYESRNTRRAAWLAALAGAAGLIASSLLKFFTGRPGLPHGNPVNILELSKTFHLGFGQGGIFWGWPSSHTTVAFAMSVALALYYRDKKWVGIILIIYAIYIGLGASMGFHWASDVVCGALLGCLVGYLVSQIKLF